MISTLDRKLPNDLLDTPIYEGALRAKREVSAAHGEDFHEFCEHFRNMERETGRVAVVRQRPVENPA